MKVCVIGCGRVGLPLALVLKESGIDTIGYDIDAKCRDSVNNGKMPFYEPECDSILKKTKFKIYIDFNDCYSSVYIITVGTPLKQHIEADMSNIINVVNMLIEHNQILNKTIILRSTVAPQTTQFVKEYIEQKTNYICGKHFYLAMCPERLAEGKAIGELYTLPQICGVNDSESFEKIKLVFNFTNTIRTTFIEAELIKLFCNIYRYINFAIPNYFMLIASTYGLHIHEINDMLNILKFKYPRAGGLATPGLCGGTCLRKDFGMINENIPTSDLLLDAYKVNEFMPKFIADKCSNIKNKTVGILGYTFKQNTDDTRDSLVPKLIRYLEKKLPAQILIHDPWLKYGQVEDKFNNFTFINVTLDEIKKKCDLVILATNHTSFIDKCNDLDIIDIWGVL